MVIADVFDRVIGFLRGGHPRQFTSVGYVPLLALLPRRLSGDEVALAVAELTSREARPVDEIDLRVTITRITGELASDADTGRITRLLVAHGVQVRTRRTRDS